MTALIGVSVVLVAFASIGLLSLSAFSQEHESGPSVPGCGTAEERVKSSDITLEDAQKLVDACLAAKPGGFVSPTPGSSEDVITFPLEEPATIALEPGKDLELPAGADVGRLMGLKDLTFFDIAGSRIWFEAETWEPFIEQSTHVDSSYRQDMRGIVEQLIDLFPEHKDSYQRLIDSHLKDGLLESTPNESKQPWLIDG